MKKVLLDLSVPCTKEKTHEYIAEQMGFPSYYGKNLDALYDELTSIHEPTAVGIFLPIADMIDLDIDLMIYFDKISEVFSDAEAANPELAVIFGDLMANPEYVDEFGDLLDSYLDGDDAEDDDLSDDDFSDEDFNIQAGDKDVLVIDVGP